MPEIGDANQIRGEEFGKMIRRPRTWILIGIASVILAVVGFLIAPFIGGIGLAVGIVIGLAVVFAVADNRAEEAFYDSYAAARGLARQGSGDLDEVTPLLRKGDKRRAEQIFTGPLSDDIDGTLALYTYTEVTTDSKGNRQESHYPFTVILTDLPDTIAHLPELLVENQSGFKAFEKLEDVFRREHERVTLESEAMRDRYEIFVGKDQDPVWVRRLFSPAFIVWLNNSPPKKFAFEMVNGKLCAFVPKHRDSAEGFDELVAAGCTVARRLRDEAS